MTGVAAFILLLDIGDQHLRALHLDFEGGDQRIFCVNDNVFRFPPRVDEFSGRPGNLVLPFASFPRSLGPLRHIAHR
jgi:hypothetical protein